MRYKSKQCLKLVQIWIPLIFQTILFFLSRYYHWSSNISLLYICPVFKVGLFFTSHSPCIQGWLVVLCLACVLYSRLACSLPHICLVIKVGLLFFASHVSCNQGWFVLCLIFALYSRLVCSLPYICPVFKVGCSLSHICPVFKVGLSFVPHLVCIQGWHGFICLTFSNVQSCQDLSELATSLLTFALHSNMTRSEPCGHFSCVGSLSASE